jgi:tRNA A-37 threonylcarbamoyl transferase component Bud32
MNLEQDFLDQCGITEYTCEKQFVSKKNKVHLVRAILGDGSTRSFVVKEYLDNHHSIQREADILEGLYREGISVPRLYYRGEGSIVMEYIKGSALLDVMTDAEYIAREGIDYINVKGISSHVSRWLEVFYKVAERITGEKTILWDINLRNFLVGYKLYGIDFEDCRKGAVEEDMGRLMAYIVTYEPAFTPFKIQFAREVYSALAIRVPLDSDRVMAEMEKEFDAIRERRGMKVPGDIVERIMAEDLSP